MKTTDKNDNEQILFLHVNFTDQNFRNFCYIYALNHLPYFSEDFPDCQKTNWACMRYGTLTKLFRTFILLARIFRDQNC